jgi:hypothetical protein
VLETARFVARPVAEATFSTSVWAVMARLEVSLASETVIWRPAR